MPKWEARASGRYRYEMDALAEVTGDTLEVDPHALSNGVLIVQFDWPQDGGVIPLKAVYPDSFPRFRPIVSLRGDRNTFPKRHCSPLEGNLCLLGRESGQWLNKWTLRKLLEEQLSKTLNDTGAQDPQGEPAEFWWNAIGMRHSFCLIDSAWTLNNQTKGALKIGYSFRKSADSPTIRAIVLEVQDQNGVVLQNWNSPIPADVLSSDEIIVPWIYIDDVILPNGSPKQIEDFIQQFDKNPPWKEFDTSTTARWFAVLHKSELGPNKFGLGWVFVFIYGPKKSFRSPKPGDAKIRHPRIGFIPTYRGGREDLGVRVPATAALRDKKVVVVGLGAIGAPLAIELARNGCGRLELVDHDVVEPGNSIRWSLGASAWGRRKTEALAEFIEREFPWTKVAAHTHAVGSQPETMKDGDDVLFGTIIPETHLMIDASASYGVSTILGDYCRSASIPLISLYASPPVHGGIVARFHPQSGCPTCLETAYDTAILSRAPGFGSEEGMQQPPGCAELTFTGAAFDLQELSLQAVRVVVDTLESQQAFTKSDVYTLSLTSNGKRSPPRWQIDELPKMEGCSCQTDP